MKRHKDLLRTSTDEITEAIRRVAPQSLSPRVGARPEETLPPDWLHSRLERVVFEITREQAIKQLVELHRKQRGRRLH